MRKLFKKPIVIIIVVFILSGVFVLIRYKQIFTYTETVTKTEEIEFETEHIEDASLPDCIHLVSGEGVKGSKEVTYEVRRSKRTDKEVEKKVTGEIILTEPVDITEVQGTFQVRNNEDFKNTEYYKYMANLSALFDNGDKGAVFDELHPDVVVAAKLNKEQFIKFNSTEGDFGDFREGTKLSMPFDVNIDNLEHSEQEIRDALSSYLDARLISRNNRLSILFGRDYADKQAAWAVYSLEDQRFYFLNRKNYLVRTGDSGSTFKYPDKEGQLTFLQKFDVVERKGDSKQDALYVEFESISRDNTSPSCYWLVPPSEHLTEKIIFFDGSSINFAKRGSVKVTNIDYILVSYTVDYNRYQEEEDILEELKITDFKKYFEVDSLVKLMDLL